MESGAVLFRRWRVSGNHLIVVALLCLMTVAVRPVDCREEFHGYSLSGMTMFEMMRKFAGEHPAEAKQVIEMLTGRLDFEAQQLGKQLLFELVNTHDDTASCNICKLLFRLLKIGARLENDMENTLDSATDACVLIANAIDPTQTVQAHILCPGIIALQGPHVYKIIYKTTTFPIPFCEAFNGCYETSPIVPNWPPQQQNKLVKPSSRSGSKKHVNPVAPGDGAIRIAHVTDIHIEPDYAENSNTDCGLTVCCQNISGTGKAGAWGHYKCNIPKRTTKLFLENIRDKVKPNYVIFSGDIAPHTMWEETAKSQLECSKALVELFTEVFENETRIFPTIGNHDVFPTNLFSMLHNNETRPIVYDIVDTWAEIAQLTSDEVQSMKTDGFYTTLIDRIGGIRLMSLNSVYMYTYNFYNVMNQFSIDRSSFSRETRAYKNRVENALREARNGPRPEKVILVGHHVFGNGDYISAEAKWFEDLVANYSDIIIMMVAGHSHADEFRLFSNPSDVNNVTGMQYVCPSIDTHGYVNPSVRVYNFTNQWALTDYAQYYFDLETAGDSSNQPDIKELYSAKNEYGLEDMTAASWLKLLDRMANNQTLLEKHRGYESALASSSGGNFSCDSTCRLRYLCKLRYASYDRYQACIHQYDPATTTASTTTRPTLPILTNQPQLDATPGRAAIGTNPSRGLVFLASAAAAAASWALRVVGGI